MPFYTFRCFTCNNEEDVMRPMAQCADPGPACCGAPMNRVFNSTFHCDEVRGTHYFHPTKRVEVKDHGRVFDLGLGKWYSTKAERCELIKRAGFQEHGSKQV